MQGRVLKGEFQTLALQSLDSLYRFALLLTGKPHTAEDLTLTTYLSAQRFYRFSKDGDDSKSWLFSTMHNIFIKEYCPEAGGALDPAMEKDEEKGGYESPPERESAQAGIERAFRALPDQLKVVIALKDVFGFDYQEIALILGCSVGTVSSRLWRGRNLLKKGFKTFSSRSPHASTLIERTGYPRVG